MPLFVVKHTGDTSDGLTRAMSLVCLCIVILISQSSQEGLPQRAILGPLENTREPAHGRRVQKSMIAFLDDTPLLTRPRGTGRGAFPQLSRNLSRDRKR